MLWQSAVCAVLELHALQQPLQNQPLLRLLLLQMAISMHDIFRKRLTNAVKDTYTAKAPANEYRMYKTMCHMYPRTPDTSAQLRD